MPDQVDILIQERLFRRVERMEKLEEDILGQLNGGYGILKVVFSLHTVLTGDRPDDCIWTGRKRFTKQRQISKSVCAVLLDIQGSCLPLNK